MPVFNPLFIAGSKDEDGLQAQDLSFLRSTISHYISSVHSAQGLSVTSAVLNLMVADAFSDAFTEEERDDIDDAQRVFAEKTEVGYNTLRVMYPGDVPANARSNLDYCIAQGAIEEASQEFVLTVISSPTVLCKYLTQLNAVLWSETGTSIDFVKSMNVILTIYLRSIRHHYFRGFSPYTINDDLMVNTVTYTEFLEIILQSRLVDTLRTKFGISTPNVDTGNDDKSPSSSYERRIDPHPSIEEGLMFSCRRLSAILRVVALASKFESMVDQDMIADELDDNVRHPDLNDLNESVRAVWALLGLGSLAEGASKGDSLEDSWISEGDEIVIL